MVYTSKQTIPDPPLNRFGRMGPGNDDIMNLYSEIVAR